MTKVVGIYALIPGLREAHERHAQAQLLSFIDLAEPILVVPVRPYTMRMAIELEIAGNAFCRFQGRRPGALDMLQFLWRVSEDFTRGDEGLLSRIRQRLAIRRLRKQIAKLNAAELEDAIWAYLRDANASHPQFSIGIDPRQNVWRPPGFTAWPAFWIDLLAHQYNWSESHILDMPLRRLGQYACRLMPRIDPEFTPPTAPREVMEMRDRFIAEANAKAKAGTRGQGHG